MSLNIRPLLHLGWDEKADPGHDHEEARRQVVHRHVFELVPDEGHLQPREGEVVAGGHVKFVPLLLQGVDADGVLEDDGAPFGVVIELHRVVVDGAGVVGGVNQQLAIMTIQRVEVKSVVEMCDQRKSCAIFSLLHAYLMGQRIVTSAS